MWCRPLWFEWTEEQIVVAIVDHDRGREHVHCLGRVDKRKSWTSSSRFGWPIGIWWIWTQTKANTGKYLIVLMNETKTTRAEMKKKNPKNYHNRRSSINRQLHGDIVEVVLKLHIITGIGGREWQWDTINHHGLQDCISSYDIFKWLNLWRWCCWWVDDDGCVNIHGNR